MLHVLWHAGKLRATEWLAVVRPTVFINVCVCVCVLYIKGYSVPLVTFVQWSYYFDTHTQPFYGSVEFVRENPGEPVPEEHSPTTLIVVINHPLAVISIRSWK